MWGALFGFLSGIVSGMGIGGGVILIPLLAIFLHTNQQPAQGINLFYFLPTAVSALVIHWKNEQIDFRPALTLMACAIPGAIVGGWIAVTISAGLLRPVTTTCALGAASRISLRTAGNSTANAK